MAVIEKMRIIKNLWLVYKKNKIRYIINLIIVEFEKVIIY